MRINELIKQKGYTKKAFACKLGMTTVGLAQILSGKPSYSSLQKIADALGVEMWELFVSREEITGSQQEVFVCPHCGKKYRLVEIS